MSLWIQITSGQGPAECCWVVAKVASVLHQDAREAGSDLVILETIPGDEADTYQALIFSLQEDKIPGWLQPWLGTIQWIGTSPYRPQHRRKNWFVGVSVLEQPSSVDLNQNDLRMDSFRGSGPGGQNVNKVESAVRLTHVPTGISVVAREARSQRENRLLALERLKRRLQSEQEDAKAKLRRQFRDQHLELVRGNAIRVYSGPDFRRIR